MCLIICLLFLYLSIGIYFFQRRTSIALVNSSIWTFLSISVLILGLPASGAAYTFVFTSTLCFTIAYFSSEWLDYRAHGLYLSRSTNNVDETSHMFETSLYDRLIRVIILLNIVSMIYLGYTLGFRLSTFTSVSRLMSRMNAISSQRYTGDSDGMPIINRLINAIVYASCAFSGFYMADKFKVMHITNLFLIVFQTIILNTKATLVFGLSFWVSGYVTSCVYQNRKLSKREIIIASVSLIAVILFSTGINYFRHGGVVRFEVEFARILTAYFIGPYSAFGVWFDHYQASNLDFGSNTFACLFRIVGIKAQEHGAALSLGEAAGTNVYTIFKHLITDYSHIGTVMICVLIGFLSGLIDNRVNYGNRRSIPLHMIIGAILLVSFFSSLFRYTTNVVACILILFVASCKDIRVK